MLYKISQLSRGVSSDDENTGQESGVLVSTEFSLLSSCCLKIFFFLQSNCFIAMQGVLVSQQKTMDKHYQYWRSPWWSQGWQAEVRLSGMRIGTYRMPITHVVFFKTSAVKNDSRHTHFLINTWGRTFGAVSRRILMEVILLINKKELPTLLREQTEILLPQIPSIRQYLNWLDWFSRCVLQQAVVECDH